MRQYSIASLQSDGDLQLIVRQEQHADGSLGICSGWLTEYLPLGAALTLRLRRNAGFHLPEDDVPLILIGNGTGLAGLRSLLRASIAAGRKRSWLLFGERNFAHDYYCRAELEQALARGELQRLDLAFSRDQAEKSMSRTACMKRRMNCGAGLTRGAALRLRQPAGAWPAVSTGCCAKCSVRRPCNAWPTKDVTDATCTERMNEKRLPRGLFVTNCRDCWALRGVGRITAERLSAISARYRRMTPLASCALRSYRDFALSVAYVEQPQSGYPPFRLGVGG